MRCGLVVVLDVGGNFFLKSVGLCRFIDKIKAL